MVHLPLVWQLAALEPLTGALVAAFSLLKRRVSPLPLAIRQSHRPDGLGLRSDQGIGAETF